MIGATFPAKREVESGQLAAREPVIGEVIEGPQELHAINLLAESGTVSDPRKASKTRTTVPPKGPAVTGPRCGICGPRNQVDVTSPPSMSTDLTGTCFMPAPM